MNEHAAAAPAAEADERLTPPSPGRARMGSLTRRMIGIAAVWIAALLLIGGFALDRVLSRSIVDNFDNQLTFVLNSMIAASEIGPDGEVRFNRPPADQRFIEPYSGLYFQISGEGADTFASRSLWDRRLRVVDVNAAFVATTGLAREQVVGRHWTERADARDIEGLLGLIEGALAGRIGLTTTTVSRADGSRFEIELRYLPVRLGDDAYALGVGRDVSDRLERERRLRDSEA